MPSRSKMFSVDESKRRQFDQGELMEEISRAVRLYLHDIKFENDYLFSHTDDKQLRVRCGHTGEIKECERILQATELGDPAALSNLHQLENVFINAEMHFWVSHQEYTVDKAYEVEKGRSEKEFTDEYVEWFRKMTQAQIYVMESILIAKNCELEKMYNELDGDIEGMIENND